MPCTTETFTGTTFPFAIPQNTKGRHGPKKIHTAGYRNEKEAYFK
jgi:hypothetical protein